MFEEPLKPKELEQLKKAVKSQSERVGSTIKKEAFNDSEQMTFEGKPHRLPARPSAEGSTYAQESSQNRGLVRERRVVCALPPVRRRRLPDARRAVH